MEGSVSLLLTKTILFLQLSLVRDAVSRLNVPATHADADGDEVLGSIPRSGKKAFLH